MNKNKKSIYKLYRSTAELNSYDFVFKRVLKLGIMCAPATFIGWVFLTESFNFKERISDWASALTVSLIPAIEEVISFYFVGVKSDKSNVKLSEICSLINDKTCKEIDFTDANVSIAGFQDNAEETTITFEFDNFYIQECIKEDVYKCGLYYSDGGFSDLTDEVSDILKMRGRRKNKNKKKDNEK